MYTEDVQAVSLFAWSTNQEKIVKQQRNLTGQGTSEAQKRLNEKKSRKKLNLMCHHFLEGDYSAALTYKNCPQTHDELVRNQTNFLRKLKRECKKRGENLEYIAVIEYKMDAEGEYIVRAHHHLLIKKCLDRDFIESCWTTGRGKNKERIGRTKCEVIQYLDVVNGAKNLYDYLAGSDTRTSYYSAGKKTWTCSRGIPRPKVKKRDRKYSFRKLEQICLSNDTLEQFSKEYPEWQIIDMKKNLDTYGRWHIEMIMRKMPVSLAKYEKKRKKLERLATEFIRQNE
jgi:hypothetical protein